MHICRGVFTKKICDTGLGGAGGQKGIIAKKVCCLLIIKNKETL